MKLVMINVGLSGRKRGLIFPDGSFVFFPIPVGDWKCGQEPRYSELPLQDFTYSKHASLPMFKDGHLSDLMPELADVQAHNDPDFKHRTYGHAVRGYGYEPLLQTLEPGDILLFLATLDYRQMGKFPRSPFVNPDWGAYIVGAFEIEQWYTQEQFEKASKEEQARFSANPHYYCGGAAALWIAGKEDTLGLFKKAVPLSSAKESKQCIRLLSENFRTWKGKKAGSTGWYRHAVVCEKNAARVWNEIMQQGGLDDRCVRTKR